MTPDRLAAAPTGAGLKAVPHALAVLRVIEPREVGEDQRPSGLARGHGQRHRAPQIRLKPGLHGLLRGLAHRLEPLGVVKHLPLDVGRRLEGSTKCGTFLAAGGVDDLRERLGVPLDQRDGFPPDTAQPSDGGRLDGQLLEEGGRQRRTERRDTPSADP